jgi:hypothetical protein
MRSLCDVGENCISANLASDPIGEIGRSPYADDLCARLRRGMGGLPANSLTGTDYDKDFAFKTAVFEIRRYGHCVFGTHLASLDLDRAAITGKWPGKCHS